MVRASAGIVSGLPYLIPLAVGAVGAVVASAFVTSRRLRSELRDESEMLDRLPPGAARAELRADVRRRTLLLVAANRFPPFTGVDLVLLLILVAAMAYGTWLTLNAFGGHRTETAAMATIYLGQFGVYITFTVFTWRAFHRPWSLRAVRRLTYVVEHLGTEEAFQVAQMLVMGNSLVRFICPAFICLVGAGIIAASLDAFGVLEQLLVPLAVAPFVGGVVLGLLANDSGLRALTSRVERAAADDVA
ncbi:hypothetical protein [Cellulomonas sp. URHB0016]